VTSEARWLRGLLALAAVFFLQEALFRNLRLDGIRPDLLLGVGIVAALVAGPERGAVVAFAAGLAGDLFVNTPFGLSALVDCVVAFMAGSIQTALPPRQRWSIPALTAVGSAFAVVVWATLGTVLGLPGLLHPRLALIGGVVAVVNAVASLPLAFLVRRALVGPVDATVSSRGYAA
jgi:rod shape-determining protein MreD